MTPPKTARLLFDGALGPMFRLHLVNLLLTALTLGVYSFWAKTRVRRYLASHTSLMGDRLEYAGTGGELFRGFLIAVFGVLTPLALAAAAAFIYLPQETAFIIYGSAAALIVLLFPIARYLGTRYRLSRTQWRGVRFGLGGRAWIFAMATLLSWLMTVLSLFLAAPQAQLLRERYRLGHTEFGDLRGTVKAPFYKAPWWSWLVLIVDLLLAGVVGWLVFTLALASFQLLQAIPSGGLLEYELLYFQARRFGVSLLGLAFFALIASVFLLYVWHQARMAIFVTERFRLSGEGRDDWVAFHPPQQPSEFLYLILGNVVIGMLTIGLAAPVIWERTMHYVSRFTIINTATLETAAQNAQAKPGFGEGLIEAFDIGVV